MKTCTRRTRVWAHIFALLTLALPAASCGLYEEIPAFNTLSPTQLEQDAETRDVCDSCATDTAAPSMTCDPASFDTSPELVRSCDAAIFVHAATGSDATADGSANAPFQTLQAAIDAAAARHLPYVLIAGADTYSGPVQLANGVSIVGGFTGDWRPDPEQTPTITANAPPDAEHQWAVLAESITRTVTLRNLRLETHGGARTHYGMRIIHCVQLTLENVQVLADDGRAGLPGARGEPGARGGDGGNGGLISIRRSGESGQNPHCPEATGGAGGSGGQETEDSHQGATPGGNASAGTPGGATDGQLGPQPGTHGGAGDPGNPGQPGRPPTISGGLWHAGEPGEAGTPGAAGDGGGGGGGGEVTQVGDVGGGGGGGGAAVAAARAARVDRTAAGPSGCSSSTAVFTSPAQPSTAPRAAMAAAAAQAHKAAQAARAGTRAPDINKANPAPAAATGARAAPADAAAMAAAARASRSTAAPT